MEHPLSGTRPSSKARQHAIHRAEGRAERNHVRGTFLSCDIPTLCLTELIGGMETSEGIQQRT